MEILTADKQKITEAFFGREWKEYTENKKDPYRTFQIFRFIKDPSSRERLMPDITYAADWFEHENVMGRDPRGESDFEAIRLVPLYYECVDALDENARTSLDRFFLKRDYSSIYGSENHAIMYRAARFLVAQFYLGTESALFEQYGRKTPEEMYKTDLDYINEYLDFRAGRAWGEFDSLGYGAEIMLILATLYTYTKDAVLKKKVGMIMDVILLDMICDSKNGLYGGAHGRIYPPAALDTKNSGMFHIYCYYFGLRYSITNETLNIPASLILSDYKPEEIVYAVERSRQYPYMNRERKHLHSVSSWNRPQINRENIALLENSFISKQTYVGERYMLGAVNRQDSYPNDAVEDLGYAHHQQHEWELTLYGGTSHKIFSHHPGDPGYHHIHNRWTGDLGCVCSTHYTNDKTALSIYTITKLKEYPYINAYVPLEVFSKRIFDGKYIFLEYPGLYISLYFSSGYRINDTDEYKDKEILSDGRRHAVVLRVEHEEKFSSLEDFAEHIKKIPVVYDQEARTLDFDGIHLDYNMNSENGVANVYPYKLYDSPYMQSEWRSGIVEVTADNRKCVYDFNKVEISYK